MTNKFEVHIDRHPHFVKYKSAEYKLAAIRFDITQDGVLFNDGWHECSDIGLKKLIQVADDFLLNRTVDNTRLSFTIPYIWGGDPKYNYFFDIHIGERRKEDRWTFKIATNYCAEIMEIEYEYRLTRNEVEDLRDSIVRQMGEFDWDNCGKTELLRFEVPDRSYEWCYSAKELEENLSELFIGDRLEGIYVNGDNIAEPLHVEENLANYYLGPRIYLEFEKRHADILAHAEGLFEIRFFERAEVIKRKHFDELEGSDEELCDTGHVFNNRYSGKTVQGVTVDAIKYWPWSARGFDESKVGDPVELPEQLHFELEDNTVLSILGCDDDYVIELKVNMD